MKVLDIIQKWKKDIGYEFIQETNLKRQEGAAIIFQFPNMKLITKRNELYAFQRDSIEGWVEDKEHGKLIVTVTSIYSRITERHVAVLLSLTFGRTAEHYKAHFLVLIKNLEHDNFEVFKEFFPGNICDFSDAEKKGFQLALVHLYDVKIKNLANGSVLLMGYIWQCLMT